MLSIFDFIDFPRREYNIKAGIKMREPTSFGGQENLSSQLPLFVFVNPSKEDGNQD